MADHLYIEIIENIFSAEGKMEASKPEDTETEGAEDEVDYGPWTARKRFRAEYVLWNPFCIIYIFYFISCII